MHADDPDRAFNKLVGGRLREVRVEKGWSQRELAEAVFGELKLDPSAITRIERGDRALKLREAAVIARVLGTGVYRLIGDWDNPHQAEFVEISRSARHEMEIGRQAFARMAVVYEQAVRLIDKHPEVLKGLENLFSDSREFLKHEAWEIGVTMKPKFPVNLDAEKVELIGEIAAAAVKNLVRTDRPDESET